MAKPASLHDRVIVERLENETKTASVSCPDAATGRSLTKEVLAVGPGKRNDKGEQIALNVKVQ